MPINTLIEKASRRLRPVTLAVMLAVPVLAITPVHAQPESEAAGETHGEAAEEHGESLLSFLSRIGNFVILAGGLYYLLRKPLGDYLETRNKQIRAELVSAAETRAKATAQLAEIQDKLAAIPGEIEALKARGKEEVAAEQVRIKQTADLERHRLIEQTRREIDRQLQIARRDLLDHAANLSVSVARERLAKEMTPEDQLRLVDRYVTQVATHHE
jgi:F-type H+-transporting ATPase subunit b